MFYFCPRLKQKFPSAFQDLCLYTELSVVMSKYNLRLLLRRFLQELFLDNTFTAVSKIDEWDDTLNDKMVWLMCIVVPLVLRSGGTYRGQVGGVRGRRERWQVGGGSERRNVVNHGMAANYYFILIYFMRLSIPMIELLIVHITYPAVISFSIPVK